MNKIKLKWLKVRTRIGFQYIMLNRVLFIRADNKKSTILLDDLRSFETNHMLKWYQERLPKKTFFRCHRSYIINCQHIDSYSWNVIIIKTKFLIPISRQNSIPFRKHMDLLYK